MTKELLKMNTQALSMMSKSYFFEHSKVSHPLLKTLGHCKVVGVCVYESQAPDLLLLAQDDDSPDFYPLADLLISDPVSPALAVVQSSAA